MDAARRGVVRPGADRARAAGQGDRGPPPRAPPRGQRALRRPRPGVGGARHAARAALGVRRPRAGWSSSTSRSPGSRACSAPATTRSTTCGRACARPPRWSRSASRRARPSPRACARSRDDAARPARPAPAAGAGLHGRPLRRAARPRRRRPARARVEGALRARVPHHLRRDPAPVPAHAPDRARQAPAAHHAAVGHRGLPRRRPPEPRLVLHELQAARRRDAGRVPPVGAGRRPAGARPGLPRHGVDTPAQPSNFEEDTGPAGAVSFAP